MDRIVVSWSQFDGDSDHPCEVCLQYESVAALREKLEGLVKAYADEIGPATAAYEQWHQKQRKLNDEWFGTRSKRRQQEIDARRQEHMKVQPKGPDDRILLGNQQVSLSDFVEIQRGGKHNQRIDGVTIKMPRIETLDEWFERNSEA